MQRFGLERPKLPGSLQLTHKICPRHVPLVKLMCNMQTRDARATVRMQSDRRGGNDHLFGGAGPDTYTADPGDSLNSVEGHGVC